MAHSPTKTTKSTPRVATFGWFTTFFPVVGGPPNCRHVAACAFAMTCAGPFGVEVCRLVKWWHERSTLGFWGYRGHLKSWETIFWQRNQVSKNYFQEWFNMKNNIKKDLRFEDLRVSRLVKSYFSPDGVVSFRLKIHQGCQRLLILGGWTRTSWMLQFFGAIQIFRKGEFFSWDCGDPVRHLVFERWSFRNWTSTFVHRCLTFEKNEQILLYIAAFSFVHFKDFKTPTPKGSYFSTRIVMVHVVPFLGNTSAEQQFEHLIQPERRLCAASALEHSLWAW